MALRIPDRVRRIGGGAVLVGAAVTVGVMIGGGNGGSGESPAKNAASDLPLASTTARAVEPQAGSLARKPVPVPPQSAPGVVTPAHTPAKRAKRRAKAKPRPRAKRVPAGRPPPPPVAPKVVPPPAAVAPKPKPAVRPKPTPRPKPPRRVEFDSSG